MDELDVRLDQDVIGDLPFIDTRQAAHILFAQKYLSFDQSSPYWRQFAREMLFNRTRVLDEIDSQLETFGSRLAGSAYHCADMWEQIEESVGDESAIVLVNPPTFSRGYEKMFDTHGLMTWNEPQSKQYDPTTDTQRLHDLLCSHSGISLMYKWQDLQGIPESHCVFATRLSGCNDAWLVSNKPDQIREMLGVGAKPQPEKELASPKWPPLSDQDKIGDDARCEIVRIDSKTAFYYRELWVHRLGPTSAQAYFMGLIDGKAAMVLGTQASTQNAIGRAESAWAPWGCLHFAIVPISRRRIQRLFLQCTTTTTFRRMAFPDVPERTGIQSTCFSKHPSVSSYRSSYRVRNREQLPDGTYRIVYEAEFSDRAFSDIFAEWHEREAKRIGSDTL